MTTTELKEYIFKENKIPFILESIGCHHIKPHPDKEYYSCANPDGDNNQAVIIYNNKHLNCINYTRKIDDKADLITLVSFYNKTEFKNTLKYLYKLLGLKQSYQKSTEKKDVIDPLYIFKKVKQHKPQLNVLEFNVLDEDETFHDIVPYVHISFFRSGIMPWTIKRFGLGYSYKYKRTIIPLRYWATGELLGTNARTSVVNFDELDIKKYYITPSYPKSINLFGLYENYDSIQKAGYVVVYESERSVLKRHSLGDETGVALSGHIMTDEQIRILIGLNVDIIISLDKDVDIEEVKYMCSKFKGIRNIYYIHDKYDLLGKKDSPADAKNEIFNYLMKYKTKY